MTERHLVLLSRDLLTGLKDLPTEAARYLVDLYYTFQADRIRAEGQVRAMTESGEPHAVLTWTGVAMRTLENEVRKVLDRYSDGSPLGRWARAQKGVGPVIAAGLLAHIDIAKASTAGAIWRFAGLDPSVTWEKKQKRPWNADLKKLCWKVGESFVKVSGKEDAFYGRMYVKRKALEEERNAQGLYADQAAEGAARVGKKTEAWKHYSAGRLPPGHLHARAKRWTVKLFLSHYHEMGWRLLMGKEPPVPYVIAQDGTKHTQYVPPPPGPEGEDG